MIIYDEQELYEDFTKNVLQVLLEEKQEVGCSLTRIVQIVDGLWDSLQELWKNPRSYWHRNHWIDKEIHEKYVLEVSEITFGCVMIRQGTFLNIDPQVKLDEIKTASSELMQSRIALINHPEEFITEDEVEYLNYEIEFGRREDTDEVQCREYFDNISSDQNRFCDYQMKFDDDGIGDIECPYCGQLAFEYGKNLDCCENSLAPRQLRKRIRVQKRQIS